MTKVVVMLSVMLVALSAVIAGDKKVEGRLDVDGTARGIALKKTAVEPDGWVVQASWLKHKNNQYLIGQFPSFKEWRKAGFTFTPAKTGTVKLYFRGRHSALPQTWTLIDDVEVDGMPLENSSFEEGEQGWHFDASGKERAQLTTGGRNGSNAAKVTHNCRLIRRIDVKAGKPVNVTYWHKIAD